MSVFQTYKPVSIHIQANSAEAYLSLRDAAQALCKDSGAHDIFVDGEDDWLTISGDDERSLSDLCSKLKKQKIHEFEIFQPTINYRCVLPDARKHKFRHTFVSSAGTGFIELTVLFEPGNLRGDISLNTGMLEYSLDKKFESALLMGLNELSNPTYVSLFDFNATLLSIDFEIRDNHPKHFISASRMALLDVYSRAEFVLVEPMLRISVSVPEFHIDDIKSDILSRGGHIEHIYEANGGLTLEGFVPMAHMSGYNNSLRAMTDGQGNFTQEFSHFSRAPGQPVFDPDGEPFSAALKMSG